jgi:hypothetical protein
MQKRGELVVLAFVESEPQSHYAAGEMSGQLTRFLRQCTPRRLRLDGVGSRTKHIRKLCNKIGVIGLGGGGEFSIPLQGEAIKVATNISHPFFESPAR